MRSTAVSSEVLQRKIDSCVKQDIRTVEKGYVVDHVVPLACGGEDAPRNMQWQTKADAKAKDKTERVGCK